MFFTKLVTLVIFSGSIAAQACIPSVTKETTYNILTTGSRVVETTTGGSSHERSFIKLNLDDGAKLLVKKSEFVQISSKISKLTKKREVLLQVMATGELEIKIDENGSPIIQKVINTVMPSPRGC